MLSRVARATLAVKPSVLYRAISVKRLTTVTNKDHSNLTNSESVASLVASDLTNLHSDIRNKFATNRPELKEICDYYFDGSGKAIRPLIICAWARAINKQCDMDLKSKEQSSYILHSQREISLISEMIHVSSLIHDDIIDNSELRRGKASVNTQWGCHKAVMAGNYVMAMGSRSLARLGNSEVVETLSQVLEDLVQGELMQFGSKETENERFKHYKAKTYRKTASLIANSCKAIAMLGLEDKQFKKQEVSADLDLVTMSFEFGKNLGIAFQLIDDVLDFTSHSENLGKPGSGADLRLGLATAPVLFAATKYPQLNAMIMRRFSNEGDCVQAFEYVVQSKGIEETRILAESYCQNAEKILNKFQQNQEVSYLRGIIKNVTGRKN